MKTLKNSSDQKSQDKDLLKFLLSVDIFDNLSKLERKNLLKYIYLRNYKKDEIIFKQNYPDVVLYVVKSGSLKVYLEENSEVKEVNVLKTKEFVGEMGLFLDENRTASVSALEDSVLLAISKKDLSEFIAKFPRAGAKILYKLGKILCEHIINLNSIVTNLKNCSI
jgi:CRP-like cAMP-binding protein